MKHFSLLKLIAALFICNVYIFCCAVAGSVSSIEVEAENNSDQTSDEMLNFGGTIDFIFEDDYMNTDNNNNNDNIGQGNENIGSIVFENLGFAKPTFANKTIYSSYMPTSSVKELTQNNVASDTSSSSDLNIVPPPVTDPYPTPELSSSSESSSSVESSSQPEPVESSSSEDSNDEPAQSDPEQDPNIPDTPDTPPNTSDEPGDNPAPPPTETPSGNSNPNTEIFRVNNGGTEVSGSAVDIVTKIVENEIGSTFAPEAIKAQAVTAYTYVKYSNLHGNAPYCLLKESTNSSVRTLVESVIGQGIYYNGDLIQAVYSASSAGSTASSQNVWGGYIPYLQGVYCELDELYDPNYGKKKTFSVSDMQQRMLKNAGIDLSGYDPASWFIIQNRTEGKYVGDMTIGGQRYFIDKDGDTLEITGRRFREIIMGYDIRSSAFDIEYDAGAQEFIITTYGYGHGVGLSQNGANNLAKYWGWDYKKILTFYFQGTEVY